MTGVRALFIGLMTVAVLASSGCGRKGDLEPPQAALIEAR
jgi:predicted small lipoprotein YifL